MECLLALLSYRSLLLYELIELLLDFLLPLLFRNVVNTDLHRSLDIRPSILHLIHNVVQLFLRPPEKYVYNVVSSNPKIDLITAVKLLHLLFVVLFNDRLFRLDPAIQLLLIVLLAFVTMRAIVVHLFNLLELVYSSIVGRAA